MNKNKWIAAILSGIAAGAILGVLLSTDSGRKGRKKILSKAEDINEKLKVTFAGFVDQFTETLNKNNR